MSDRVELYCIEYPLGQIALDYTWKYLNGLEYVTLRNFWKYLDIILCDIVYPLGHIVLHYIC